MVDQVGPVTESEPRLKQTFSYQKGAFKKKLKFSGAKMMMVVAMLRIFARILTIQRFSWT